MATFCRQTQDQAVETKKTEIFDTVIELDITRENGCFGEVFGHLGYVNLHGELRNYEAD